MSELFASPGALPMLLLVPLLWLLLRRSDANRERRLAGILGLRMRSLAGDLAKGQRRKRRRLTVIALLLALIALLQPQWGTRLSAVEQRGVDIMICLDVSRSMLARDIVPDRLRRAQREIRALAERTRGDRLALIAFAGDARLIVPLTRDIDSFCEMVDRTDSLSVRRGGTDLAAALETAIDSLGSATGDHEVVLLITDGEDHAQLGLAAAEKCAQIGITVHCLGLGSVRGSKITLADELGESFLRSRSGEEVISSMDAPSLRKIAAATGGDFVDALSRNDPLVQLYEQRILPRARKAFAAEQRRERKQHYQWPLLVAFLLWMLEFCLTDRRTSARRRP